MLLNNLSAHSSELSEEGFTITEPIFNNKEIEHITNCIDESEKSYAIRQLFNKIPELQQVIFSNKKFKNLYNSICDKEYFLSKAIFFNKPKQSNWFVNHHQDLSISAKEKTATKGYTNWTNKNGQLGVIPPKEILENSITFRIHLDKTDVTNGALRVIPKSHQQGIIRIDASFEKDEIGEEVLCEVEKGGIMLMKPLLLHASDKSISDFDRRVIHLEFCNREIPMGWLEKKKIV